MSLAPESDASDNARPLRLAVLISGGGTTLVNLQRKIDEGTLPAKIVQVLASRDCLGIRRAEESGLPFRVLRPKVFGSIEEFSQHLFDACRANQVDLVVLAGFLSRLVIPVDFFERVMNIHPALIPSFCGQGMYGHHVHEAVLDRGCKVSGCTVHFCDNEYDHGPIILQRSVPVLDDDSAETLAARVFATECEVYPEAIELFAHKRLAVVGRRVRVLPERFPPPS